MKYLKRYNESVDPRKEIEDLEIEIWKYSFNDMMSRASGAIERYDDRVTKGGAKGYPKANVTRHYVHSNISNETGWYDYFRNGYYERDPEKLLKRLRAVTVLSEHAWWEVSFIFDPGAMYTRTTVSDAMNEYGEDIEDFINQISTEEKPVYVKYSLYGMGETKEKNWTGLDDIRKELEDGTIGDEYIVGMKIKICYC